MLSLLRSQLTYGPIWDRLLYLIFNRGNLHAHPTWCPKNSLVRVEQGNLPSLRRTASIFTSNPLIVPVFLALALSLFSFSSSLNFNFKIIAPDYHFERVVVTIDRPVSSHRNCRGKFSPLCCIKKKVQLSLVITFV